MKKKLFSRFTISALALLLAIHSFASESFEVKTFKTHSRLLLRVDEGVDVRFSNLKSGFEIFLKGVGLTDLGAPLGEEDQWRAQFKGLRDARVEGIHFTETREGVKIEGKWKFPVGKAALADPRMEYFDFREKNPRYVVDFWVKQGPTVAEVEAARIRNEKLSALRVANERAKSRAARKIASEKAKMEAEDVGKFCRDPLGEKKDIFLQFLPFHEKVDFTRWFPARAPDANFPYFVPTAKTKEAQYVRLAQSLYKQSKVALAIRTLDFFEQEFPGSDYRNEMRFLRANALIKLGMHQEAEQILSRLMTESDNSPVGLHTGMFLAGQQVAKGIHLNALETFLWLIAHHPDHRLNWVFHLGAAESLYALKQTERAAKEYEWVVENAPDEKAKAEGAIRAGDLYLERFQYEQALAGYFRAIRHFKDEAKSFPSIHINRAEALYQLGQFDQAKESFEDFLHRYSGHSMGWRATFRLGEIHGRKEGLEAIATSRKWFYETINRFPTSAGETLARLRLLPCGDHAGLSLQAMNKFMDEAAIPFDGRGEVSPLKYKEFRALAQVRSLVTMNHEDDAVALAIKELQTAKNAEARRFLGGIVSGLFRKSILKLLDDGKKYEALAFYSEKKGMISKEAAPVDQDYVLKLSQAAADLGLGKASAELTAAYEKAQAQERGREVASSDPADPSDLEGQLRKSEESFVKAKALWVSTGEKSKAEIRELLSLVREESPLSGEREVILGLLDERERKHASALGHAVRARLLGDSADVRLEAWQAALQLKAGDSRIALGMYQNLEKKLALRKDKEESGFAAILGVPPSPSIETVVMLQGEIHEKLGEWDEASAIYDRAIRNGWGGNRALYGYGRALLKSGTRNGAIKGQQMMEKLAKSDKDDFWRRLASETLANEKTRSQAKEGGK